MFKRLALILPPLALAACQSAMAPPPPPQVQPQPQRLAQEPRGVAVTPRDFRLPEGSGCQGEIARFRAIQSNDLQTGHTTQAVYDQIEQEMQRADALCASGNAGGASAHLQATKRRFGYP